MIKIKWIGGRTAIINDKGQWEAPDKNFEDALNTRAGRDQVTEYTPDISQAMLAQARKQFKGLEVLEATTPQAPKIPKGARF